MRASPILWHDAAMPVPTGPSARLLGADQHVSTCAPARGVAQLGRAPALGAGGRRFKSCRPDITAPRTHIFSRRAAARGRSQGERTGMVNSTVEKLTPTRVKLHITVSPDELKPSIAHAYEHIAEDVQIPGFRKGKVPAADHRPARRPRRRARARRQRGPRHVLPPGRRGERAARARPPEADVKRMAEREGLLGRPARRRSRSTCAPSSIFRLRGHHLEVDASRSTRLRSTRSSTACASRFGTLVTVDRPAADRRLRRARPRRHDRRRRDRPRRGRRRTKSAPASCSRASTRRSTRSPPARTTNFRSTLIGGDHAGEDGRGRRDRHGRQGARAPEADDDFAQIASEFDTLAELRGSLSERVEQSRRSRRAPQRATSCRAAARRRSRSRCRRRHRGRGAPHLEGEGRLEDDVHRAEVTEASEKQFRTQMLLDAIAEKLDVQVRRTS